MYQAGGISSGSLYLRFKGGPRAKTFVLFAKGERQDRCERLDDAGRFVPFTPPLNGAGDGLYRYALCGTPLAFLEYRDGNGFATLSPVVQLSCADGFDCWLADAGQSCITRVTPDELFGRTTGYTLSELRPRAAERPSPSETAEKTAPNSARRLRYAAAAAALALVLTAGILPLCRRADSAQLPPQDTQAELPMPAPADSEKDDASSAETAPALTPSFSDGETASDAPAASEVENTAQEIAPLPAEETRPAEQDPAPAQDPAAAQDPAPVENDLAAALEGTHLRLEQLQKIILLCRAPVSDTLGIAHGEWETAGASALAQSLPAGVEPSVELRRIDAAGIDALRAQYYEGILSEDAFHSVIAPTLVEADGVVYELRSVSVPTPDPDTLAIEVLSPWNCICSMQAIGRPDVTLFYGFSAADGPETLVSVW